MNRKAKLHILSIYLIILSLGVGGSQASSDATNEMVIGQISSIAGAYVKNIDNPTSLQAIKDYAFGATEDLVEAGAVSLANYAIYKSIIYKGASEIVAARAVGNYAAAEAIKDSTIAEASAAMGGISVGVIIVTLALVVVGITFPNHIDDDCAVDPSGCAQSGLGTPRLPSPTSGTSSGGSNTGRYAPSTTTTVRYSYNIPGEWKIYPQGSSPFDARFDPDGKAYMNFGYSGWFEYGSWELNGNNFRWHTPTTGDITGIIDEDGTIRGNVDRHDWYSTKIGGNARTTIVVTSNVAGVGPLGCVGCGGGGGSGGTW